MPDVADLLADLAAEQEALDEVVARLPAEAFATATPSPRWTVADQLAHLTYFDGTAALAITDPEAFTATIGDLLEAAAGGDEAVDAFTLGQWQHLPPDDLLAAWRTNRRRLADAAAGLRDGDRVPWYGPPMGAVSFLTARLMEAWAHGQDIVDAVGAHRPATDRLRHVADLGYRTRRWSYLNRGMEAPEGDVAVVVTGPSGDTWTWGASDTDRIEGSAEDFCLVVTQRRHLDDTDLAVTGDRARDWMERAQAFAGPATDGPRPKES